MAPEKARLAVCDRSDDALKKAIDAFGLSRIYVETLEAAYRSGAEGGRPVTISELY